MDGYSERVAAVFGALEPSLATKSSGDAQPMAPDHDRKRAASSHHKSQSIYIPLAKKSDTRSSSSDFGDRSDHRERKSREHDERDLGRERHRRHSRGGGHGGRYRAHKEPDYVRNPSKWTKYDLKEDGSQVLRGMSQDQVNKYAAFQFLDEIKKRKSSSSLETVTESDNSDETSKVVFKKPSKSMSRTGKQGRGGDSVRSEDGDLKMRGQDAGGGGIKIAEYVVGSKTAAQLHRERRQKRAKLVSLVSEELEDSGEREGRGDMDSGHDRDVVESGGRDFETSKKKAKIMKKKTVSSAAVSLSHLEEEDEDA